MRTNRRGIVGRFATLLALGLAIAGDGCGGLSVSPAAPTPVKETLSGGHPTLLNIRGTLADGGSFDGYIIYGSKDLEGRLQFGRYQALYWDVVVKGGAQTRDARFTYTNQGRALIEAYAQPYPTIGVNFLWPDRDPELQRLTPHFHASDAYDPDRPPDAFDFGGLIPSEPGTPFGIFVDGQGNTTRILFAAIAPAESLPDPRTDSSK